MVCCKVEKVVDIVFFICWEILLVEVFLVVVFFCIVFVGNRFSWRECEVVKVVGGVLLEFVVVVFFLVRVFFVEWIDFNECFFVVGGFFCFVFVGKIGGFSWCEREVVRVVGGGVFIFECFVF